MDLKDLALRLVLDWLPLRDVVRCGHVCSRWRGVAKDPDFWRNKRLKLEEFDDCLAVVSFAPCLRELRVNVWGSSIFDSVKWDDEIYAEPDAFYTFCFDLVEVINESGIKITKFKFVAENFEDYAIDSLLLAVSEHIVELEIDDTYYIDEVPFMPELRVLTINEIIEDPEERRPWPICTGSLEVLEMQNTASSYVPLELIHHNAAKIQELRLGEVSWDQLGVFLKLKRLRLLGVSEIIGDLPTPLPTPECQIEILKFNRYSRGNYEPSELVSVATNNNALLDLLSSSVSELTVYSPNNILVTRLAAMPKLRRLHLHSSRHSAAPCFTLNCSPENSSPIAPVEYVFMEGFDTPDMASVLKTFAATLKEASLLVFHPLNSSITLLAKLPTQDHGGSVDRPPGSLQIDYIRLESYALPATLRPLLLLFAATLRKISIFCAGKTLMSFDSSVLFDFMSYIIQHNGGELQQVEILYSPVMTEDLRKYLHFQLQPLRQKVPNFIIRPYSEYEQRQCKLFM